MLCGGGERVGKGPGNGQEAETPACPGKNAWGTKTRKGAEKKGKKSLLLEEGCPGQVNWGGENRKIL